MKKSINLYKKHYLDVSKPGSFAGLAGFSRALKKRRLPASKNEIENVLKKEEAYTMHKTARKRYNRNQIVTKGIDHIWQIDFVDMKNIKNYNDNIQYFDVYRLIKVAYLTKYTLIKEKNS